MNQIKPFDQMIALLTRIFAELEAKALQESELSELSMKQLVYLDTISQMEQPTFSDLAKKHGVSKPSVTAIVGKLIQKGYVQKVQSNDDRRSFHILLTEKGKQMGKMHDQFHHTIAQHFTRALDSREMQQLARLLKKVIQSPGM